MWPFSKAATKENLQEWKRVRVNGWTFTIRRLNPLLDFPGDKMPQIFTAMAPSRKPGVDKPVQAGPEKADKGLDELRLVLSKGVVSPKIGIKEGEGTLSADDLIRDEDTAGKLYIEIMAHSMKTFRGLKGFFLWARIRRSLYTAWAKSTASAPVRSDSLLAP
jgi:hypothetical protein